MQGVDTHRSCPGSAGIGNNGEAELTRTRPVRASSAYGVPDGIDRHAAQNAAADQRRPGVRRRPPGQLRATIGLELIDLIERLDLRQGSLGRAAQPRFLRVQQLLPHEPGGRPIVAAGQHGGRDGGQPVRRVRLRGRALEPLGRGLVIVQPPVIDEPDVVVVLPLVRASPRCPCGGAPPPGRGGPGRPDRARRGRSRRSDRRC